MLERRHESQSDGLTTQRDLGGVTVHGRDHGIGHWLDPGVVAQRGGQRPFGGGCRPQVHGPCPPPASVQHRETHVGRDAIQPRTQLGLALEPVESAPGTDHRVLDRVIGLETGTQHPMAVAGELPAVCLELQDGVVGGAGGSPVPDRGVGRGHRHVRPPPGPVGGPLSRTLMVAMVVDRPCQVRERGARP